MNREQWWGIALMPLLTPPCGAGQNNEHKQIICHFFTLKISPHSWMESELSFSRALQLPRGPLLWWNGASVCVEAFFKKKKKYSARLDLAKVTASPLNHLGKKSEQWSPSKNAALCGLRRTNTYNKWYLNTSINTGIYLQRKQDLYWSVFLWVFFFTICLRI